MIKEFRKMYYIVYHKITRNLINKKYINSILLGSLKNLREM